VFNIMPAPAQYLVRIAFAAVGWMANSARAELAASSPFLPPKAPNSTAPTAGAPLEYGGYLDTPTGERLYRIKDPARKTSEWVKLNERSPGLDLTAKQYDDGQNTLVVEFQGRTLTLAERESKIISSGNLPPVPVPSPNAANQMPAAVTQAVVVNPTPADEQRRLEAVATEVARRRALREQSAQQINQVPPPPVAPANQRNFQPGGQGQNPQNPQRGRGPGGRQQR
jgi:hypothetical protein